MGILTVSSPREENTRPYHHGDLRTALLQATGEVIREKGVASVSLREVARRVGVSHAAPAHHFSSKAILVAAFAAQGYARLADSIGAELDKHPPEQPRRRLQAVGEGYIRFALANPEHFSIMFRSDMLDVDEPSFQQAGDEAFNLLAGVVGECAAAGLIPRSDVGTVGVAAWSLVHGFATLWIGGRLGYRMQDTEPDALGSTLAGMFADRMLAKEKRKAPARLTRQRK